MVQVFIRNDQVYENDEMFQARLTLPQGSTGVQLGIDTAMATIIDDDGKRLHGRKGRMRVAKNVRGWESFI